MGIDPFLTASAVRLIVAQRLIRLICTNCKIEVDANRHELLPFLNLTPEEKSDLKLYKGEGCPLCNNTGYHGRCGLYEILPINLSIQELIISKAPPYMIKNQAISDGMLSLRHIALEKLRAGLTTVEEVLGATS
jgi:type IV pilus assembly protein PilB